jgi:putative transcriptional regulator
MATLAPPSSSIPHPWRPLATTLRTLLLLLLLSAPLSAADSPLPADSPSTPASPHLTAILLTAHGNLPDPDFADSVVLVMNNLAPAPVGVIVNRPTKVSVAELFPDLKRLAPLHAKVYFGGPVELDTVWFLFRASKPPKHAIRAFADVWLSADRDLLLTLLTRDKPMDALRLFLGHSGWAPGQLEAEIKNGDWTLGTADPNTIFSTKSNHPWPSSQTPKPNT